LIKNKTLFNLISDLFNLDFTFTSFGHLRCKFLPIVLIEMVATLFGSDSFWDNLLLHFSAAIAFETICRYTLQQWQ